MTGSAIVKANTVVVVNQDPAWKLAADSLLYTLDSLIDPMILEDYIKVQEILQSSSLIYIEKSYAIYTHKIVKRWNGVKEAAAKKDFNTLRKLLIDHIIWRLEIAIEYSSKNNALNYTAAISKLGPPTPKQINKLAECKSFAMTVNNDRKESYDWGTYILGGLAGTSGAWAGWQVYKKNFKGGKLFGGIGALCGIGAFITNYFYKNKRSNAIMIENHLHTKD